MRSDAFVKDLEEDDRSPEKLAAIKAAAEGMDMEKVCAVGHCDGCNIIEQCLCCSFVIGCAAAGACACAFRWAL